MAKLLKAVKCPSDELSLTNCAIVNTREFEKVRHVEISGQSQKYIFTIRPDNLVQAGEIGFGAVQVGAFLFLVVSARSKSHNCPIYDVHCVNHGKATN